jgi:hypothetical protein
MLTESEREEQRAARFPKGSAAPSAPRIEVPPGTGTVRTPLGGADCRAQIERQGATLHEGLGVLLVDDGREVDAVAHWDAQWGGWFAEPRPPRD